MLRNGLVAGAAAAAIMTGILALLRLLWAGPSLMELLSQRVVTLTPLPALAFILRSLEGASKPSLYLLVVLLQIGAGGLLGLLYQRLAVRFARSPGNLGLSIAYGTLLWLVTILAVVPLLGGGFFGAEASKNPPLLALTLLLSFVGYGLALGAFLRPEESYEAAQGAAISRRQFLRRTTAALTVVASGGLLWQVVTSYQQSSRGSSAKTPRLPSYFTPNSEFYKVSKNLSDPTVDKAGWRLSIKGLLTNPMTLSFDDLRRLPAIEQVSTLSCISNDVGGDLIGNASWKGVRLVELLNRAGVAPNAIDVVFRAADGYSDSITIQEASAPTVLVVYQMNGEPLPNEHGAPARLIVPGIYGMKNVKWVTTIELVDHDYKGFWQEQGWSDEAVMETTSRIDVPRDFATVSFGTLTLGGIAFAGRRGVSRVEVSTDEGATWQEAGLHDTSSPLSWVIWESEWMPPGLGRYQLWARATDGGGKRQVEEVTFPLPDGATGLHKIVVDVSL